jgi:hypothetical protein
MKIEGKSVRWRNRYLGIVMIALGFFPLAANSQVTGASMNGTVRDATGATVENAEVTATNTQTNAQMVGHSNKDGEYTVLNLQPGTYALSVTAAGFNSYRQTGILLNLGQHATQDISLQIGGVQQQVTVSADVSALDTTSSVISAGVNGTSIRNLPLNTRNPFSLLEIVPGYSGSIGNDYNAVSYSVDGGDNEYGDILVDGTPAGFPTVNGFQGVGIFPSVDAIGEFRLLAQDYPAEFGRSLDGILNVVFKAGTNEFHGTAFEFIRNSALDANDFFSNLNGKPLPPFRRNQFGGTLSGPIYRNKTFFLISTELLRQNSFQSLTATVPTLAQRSGDFSQTYGANGNLITVYNPFSTHANPNGSGYVRDAFPGNVIPQGLMSQVAQNVLKYYPLPNVTGAPLTNANNYYANGSVISQTTAWDVRVDHTLSDRQKIFGRYSNRYYDSDPNPLFPAADAVAEGLINGEDYSRGVTLGYTATPNARSVFDARLGFARTLYNYANTSLGFQAATLGLPASIDAASGTPLFPVFSPSGYVGLGNNGNRHNAFMTYSLLSSFTLERGNHTIKVGFDGRMVRVNDHESADSSGNFSFGTNFTQGPDPNAASANSGNGLASMLLGTGTGDMIQAFKDDASQSYYFAEYLQDDWRATPKLTLNLGIRYDLDTPRTERFNRMNYFDPTIAAPLQTAVPGLKGGLVFVGVDGKSRYQYHVDANNFAPRIGFAYSPQTSTVVHGGAAIVYGASTQAAAGTVGPYGFRVQNTWVSTLDGITPYNTLDNPFPLGFHPPPGASQGLNTGVGGQIEGVMQNTPTPYMIQWGLDVQQTLPFQAILDIGYVGNRSRKLIQSGEGGIDFDQLPTSDLALGSALNASVANPFYGSITTGTLAAATTSRGQLLKNYPQFTSVLPLRLGGGNEQYDALQVSLNKRLTSGLQLQGSYVWSKNYSNGTTHQDSFNPMADYAISSQDIHQRFIMSYIYQLPFGRGRRFGGQMSALEDVALGGWQVNGITTIQGGNPLQITGSNTLSSFDFQTLYANTNFQNASLSGPIDKRFKKYFNTADFSQPAPFTLGNGPAYYDNLRSPGLSTTDFSLFKEFSTYRMLKVQFRAEAFNVFNHVQFGSPDTKVTDTSFGAITSQANSPRQIQFGLKLLF